MKPSHLTRLVEEQIVDEVRRTERTCLAALGDSDGEGLRPWREGSTFWVGWYALDMPSSARMKAGAPSLVEALQRLRDKAEEMQTTMALNGEPR